MHLTEEKERVANYKPVYVTEITDTLHFYTQDVETGTLILLCECVCACESVRESINNYFNLIRFEV